MNSLANTMSGPSGSASSVAYQLTGTRASRASLCSNHDGTCLDERDRDAVEEFRHATPGAEASAIKVPRPGPSSATVTRVGSPIDCQTDTDHRPISSPKIWLISGAVMKSPAPPIGWREA